MARWFRGQTLPGLRCHSDAGGQDEFNWSSQHYEIMEVCDGSSSTGCGSGGQTEVEVARSPEVSMTGQVARRTRSETRPHGCGDESVPQNSEVSFEVLGETLVGWRAVHLELTSISIGN
jgi:hypothetical protein